MSKAAHTPGPWRTGGYTIKACDGNLLVAKLYRAQANVDPEGDANAHLIAAAPDLLAAAKLALSGFEAFEESARGNSDLWMPTILASDTIRAAIAKAEGRSP